MDKYYLGIDTSAYTTSIAVVNQSKEVIADYRKILEVKRGNRGLRQQEAVFQHIKNLPSLISKLNRNIDIKNIQGISASIKPRNHQNSYMPVFKVAEGQALIMSNILNIPFKKFSHQDGHIASGLIENYNLEKVDKFLALHISGGTTELLLVENKKTNYNINIIGGTKDISAGQLIDRIGVKLGLIFPAGKEMDIVSNKSDLINEKIPVSTEETWLNFSGTETFFNKVIDSKSYEKNKICKSVFYSIAKSLIHIIRHAIKTYKINDIMIIGGVASNNYIRTSINKEIIDKDIGHVYFPTQQYCTDNAVGIAYLGCLKEGL